MALSFNNVTYKSNLKKFNYDFEDGKITTIVSGESLSYFTQLISNLEKEESMILSAIEIEPKSFDCIQNETKLSTDDLLTNLTTLELKGIIKQVEGDRYTKV